MTPLVTQRPRARLDLLEQFVYFGHHGGVELAERYLSAVETTCIRLAAQPQSGTRYHSGLHRLGAMRQAAVRGFPKYLIFYLPSAGRIDVVRVLHSARDIQRILQEEDA
jgi:toxin ParE1/3/4